METDSLEAMRHQGRSLEPKTMRCEKQKRPGAVATLTLFCTAVIGCMASLLWTTGHADAGGFEHLICFDIPDNANCAGARGDCIYREADDNCHNCDQANPNIDSVCIYHENTNCEVSAGTASCGNGFPGTCTGSPLTCTYPPGTPSDGECILKVDCDVQP